MSNYTKTTNFATKDNLSPGNPLKIVKGTEIDTEYNNIATAVATKTDNASAAITGGSITGITDLAVADGGTGASTAAGALNNLLPSQTGNANKYLQTDGTNASWDAVSLSTADITGTLPVANGGTGVTSSTGTGSVVLSNSPTLVTPALGTPSSGTATNLTGLPISTGVSGLGTGVATFLGTPSSANLASAVTDETGSGALVFANSPTLVTPTLGTPASATLTNATGLPISTGVSGLGTGVATFLATPSSANLISAVTDETGTGSLVFATSPTLVTPALGTPSALVGTNITGTASGLTAGNVTTNANLTGAVTSVGNATSLGSFTSSQLATALTDETGSGANVFATSPTLVTPILGTPTSATLTNATGLPISTGVSGLGTGVATALAVNVGSSGAPLVNGGVLGTPSSGTATNLTGLPISTGVSGLGTGVATALAVNVGSAGAAVVNGGALGTPSGGTATNLTGLPLTTGVTGQLPVANGGTGTATPSIVAGTNVTVTGTWPNQTIAASGGGSGTVTSVAATVPSVFSISGSPITTSGTLAMTYSGTALPVANGGTGVTTSTGTGNVVLSASPTLTGDVTLNAQGDLRFADADSSNWVAFQAPATIASNVTWTLPSADGTSGQILSTNGSGTLSFSGTPTLVLSGSTVDGTNGVGYINLPQNAQTGSYTLVLGDAAKHIYHASGAGAATYTIPANSSVAYPIGTAVTFVNMSATSISIAITTDTMYLAKDGTTGTRTLAQYGSATALKLTSTTWLISGSALT